MSDNNPDFPGNEDPTLTDADLAISVDDRNMAMIAHLSGCAGLLFGGLIGFAGPLVVYLLKKDSSYFVETQAKEALNFQITLLLAGIGCSILAVGSCFILWPLLFAWLAISILQVVFGIIAAMAVHDGKTYRYPFILRLFQ